MPFVEVSDKDTKSIKARYDQGVPMWQLKEEFGHSRPVIRRIIEEQGGTIRARGRFKGRRVASSPVLSEKLTQLAGILKVDHLNHDVVKTIVNYALRHNDGRTFRKIDRRYDYNGTLSQFRRDHLEASYYIMGRLWRAVYRAVKLESGGRRIQAADFGVAAKDVSLCLSVLDDADRAKILSWLDKTGDYVHLPNEDGVQRVVAECEKTMKSIVGSKLRFIYKYDPAFEAEDLVSYLRVVAYRVAVKYDWEKLDGSFAYLKCLNYTKRSLWNAAYLLIKENSSESNGGTGNYNRLDRVGTEEREYQVTTISMDSSPDCDIEDWLSMEQVLGEAPDTSIEVLELVDQVADDKLLRYLRLEFEDVPEFSEFVMKETGQEENALYTGDYSKWRQLAMRFAGLLKSEDRAKYKRLIRKEMGIWDESQVRRST